MNINKILTIVFICLLFVVALLFYILKDPQNGIFSQNTPTTSPDILYLTTPITSFTGTIDKIEGKTLWVTQKMNLQQPIPTQKNITIKGALAETTVITKITSPIPYLFKTVPMIQTEILNETELKVGQSVMISLDSDLRFATTKQPMITSIQIIPPTSTIMGKILDVQNGVLTVKTLPLPAAMIASGTSEAEETIYTVAMTSETEISRNDYSSTSTLTVPKSIKMALSDLKKDMQVTIYTNTDVLTTKNIIALRIEPQVITAPVVPTTPLNSAPPVTTVPVTASPAAN